MADAAVYDHQAIEEKWQAFWEQAQLFQHSELGSGGADGVLRDPLYLLFAFAYPSGSGLHVGHVESKTALDIIARFYRMQGRDVFFPVGWDAFGLPAENYAIKTGVPPATTTKEAITTFRRQIKRIGISYDWANELATNHPEYYRWTQWLFIQLYNKGLAYQGDGMVNWCPSCQTVLANEQVVNGACERCDSEVIQKKMKQWFFKITEYKDELIAGLDQVDWPAATKQQQLNWIGKSEGATISFPLQSNGKKIAELEVYTTAHDTIFGCTFMVVAPEHTLLTKHKSAITNWEAVSEYIEKASSKTDLQRQTNKEKSGIQVEGLSLLNPFTQESVPLFVADYVLANYGTGAIMAVPAHDERDHEFALKHQLPVKSIVEGDTAFISYSKIKEQPTQFTLANSGKYSGLNFKAGRQAILQDAQAQGFGRVTTQYKLRDWLISRQRYWGAPIPIVYDPEGKPHPVKEEHLPWTLPTDVDFKPTGESPLTSSKEFKSRVEKLYGKGWRPEYDTMDTFVDSSWYYLRYVDARNTSVFARRERLEQWLPVDFYMIGPEHIVLHLLYSRFFTKFLRDEGHLEFDEPFTKMRHQGMILGPDGKKMSKSKGNVINPDEVIEKFGADTLRMYEMFMGPIEADKPWDVRAVVGVYKFLQRVHKKVSEAFTEQVKTSDPLVERKLHQTIKKITGDIPSLKFNTAIAALMEFLNSWESAPGSLKQSDLESFILLLAPFAPFLAEELWQMVKDKETADRGTNSLQSVHLEHWPVWSEDLAREELVTLAVQVNGKVRAELEVAHQLLENETEVTAQAQALPALTKYLEGQVVVKTIYVPGKIVSLVLKPDTT